MHSQEHCTQIINIVCCGSNLEAELIEVRAQGGDLGALDFAAAFELEAVEQADLPFGERVVQVATRCGAWANKFFLQQNWGTTQIVFLYVVMLHYYAIFYKRSVY